MRVDADLAFMVRHPEVVGKAVGFRDMTEMHGRWIAEMVAGEGDYTLQAHRGSYKSSTLAVAIALLIVFQPKRNIIFLRKADNDVAEMLGMVGKILKNDLLIDLANVLYGKPLKITEEAMDHLSTNLWDSPMGAPQLLGIGLKSSITGKHAYYVITDDICNISDRISRAERERTKLQYDELQNIRNRGGRIINLGTPWHKDDVFSKMPNIHRYDCYSTGLIDREKLAELRRSMAPSLFAANYELKHIASGQALFTKAPEMFTREEILYDGISHVDAAYGGSDATALTCAVRVEETIYLYGRLWHGHVDRAIDEIIELADRFRCWPMYCEENGDRGFLVKEINERDRWAKGYAETENKRIKIGSYLRKYWEKIRILEGTDPEYIDQILDYSPEAEHDDAPDSAASICRILDAGYGWGVKDPEEIAE